MRIDLHARCLLIWLCILTVPANLASQEAAASATGEVSRNITDLQLRLTGNWGWLGVDLNNNPVQRAFSDDLVKDGESTWKFGYLVAQLRAQGQLRKGDWACVLQFKYQERGADPFTEQLRDDIELDLGFCAYEQRTTAGHLVRLAAGEKHFPFGLKPADVPLLDVFPERAAVVYGESIRRRTSGGMVEVSFTADLAPDELEVVAYWVYDYLLGFGFQTQDGAVLDEIHTEAYGAQLTWRTEAGLSLSLGARETGRQSTENLLLGVPEQTELIASAEWLHGRWTATWETVYTDVLNYNDVPGQLDEERFGTYVEVSRASNRWAFALRGSYAWASQDNPRRVDPRLQDHPGLISFLPFSFDPVRWELGVAARYAIDEHVHLKAAVTTGDYGFLSDIAFTPEGELALFSDTGQDTQYSVSLGFGLGTAWKWLRGVSR